MSNDLKNILKEKINEISLILVMTPDGDAVGTGILVDLCNDLSALASGDPEFEKICKAAVFINENKDSPSCYKNIQDTINCFVKFIEDTDVTFPHENKNSSAIRQDSDEAEEDIDQEFIKEYIETHTLMLEDFEASILDCKNDPSKSYELGISVKRYLHNLKGDSGSVGLSGIGHACHTIEDMLVKNEAATMIQHLLNFKEWVIECMNDYAAGRKLSKGAKKFLAEVAALPLYESVYESENSKKSEVAASKEPQVAPIKEVEKSEVKSASVSPSKSPLDNTQKEYSLSGEMDILMEFSIEAEEHLGNMECVVLDSQGEYTKDNIDTIFRCVHSLKGGSAYFTLFEMTKCSHILENYLSEVRDGKRVFDPVLGELVLIYIDLQKNVLSRAKKAASSDGKMQTSQDSIEFLVSLDQYGRGEAVKSSEAVTSNSSKATSEQTASETAALKQLENMLTEQAAKNSLPAAKGDGKEEKLDIKTFVKVETVRLDNLIDSIGEMTIYTSMLIRHCRDLLSSNPEVMDATHRVEKLARDLQDVGMSMRLVPIKGLFQKMSRLVWDTSKKIGKDINFIMEGEDTELDRNLIDKLADPLMHMVRNSMDHGIESPEDRIAQGKPKAGKVSLSAYHSGGSIHIKISDDGKGLDPEKLLAKALEKGVIQEGQKLSQTETFQLIFAAGFSTAAVVTDLSGRGVGMDVVRRNVESLRGRIHIESTVGIGSTFTIELPLTLAIIDGIQVEVGSENFLIPSLSIVEFLKPKPEMLSNALDKGETLHFRGKYLPIFRLGDLYNFEPRYHDPLQATMIIVEYNHEHIALMVDEILGECSTVIKSLGSLFEEGKGIAGCAIMPRGNVALILDIISLVQLARASYRVRPSTPKYVEAQVLH